MARFGREIVRGLRGESQVFPREIVELYTRRRNLVPGSSRALSMRFYLVPALSQEQRSRIEDRVRAVAAEAGPGNAAAAKVSKQA